MRRHTQQTHTSQPLQRCISPACGESFDIGEHAYVCLRCGGPLEIEFDLAAVAAPALKDSWEARAASKQPCDRSGVWRYRELLPFADGAPVVTLYEGNTPVYEAPRCAQYCGLGRLHLKHLGCNPTGSFKDLGMTTALTQAKILGARTVVCASTGNTAASMAAYAARAAIDAVILVPQGQISAAKLAQSMDYGAGILQIEGNFDAAMRLVQDLAADRSIYVANSMNPFRIEGQKTAAFELLIQHDWRVPDHVVVPGGNLGNSAALAKGFGELRGLGLIDCLPKLSVVQAKGAAPLANLFSSLDPRERNACGDALPGAIIPAENPQTLATAIRIGTPVSWRKSLRGVLRSGGQVLAVTESEIADAKAMIGRDGIGCEPASATTVAGIRKMAAAGYIGREDVVVAILTGHVLKDPDYVSRYHLGALALEPQVQGEAAQPIAGAFRNEPQTIRAAKSAVLSAIERRRAIRHLSSR